MRPVEAIVERVRNRKNITILARQRSLGQREIGFGQIGDRRVCLMSPAEKDVVNADERFALGLFGV